MSWARRRREWHDALKRLCAHKAIRAIEAADVLGLAGVAAAVYGISLWSIPAAWVVSGIVLVLPAVAQIAHGRNRRP